MQGRERNADLRRLDAERRRVVDTISIDYAFFGDEDERAKPVLVVREHKNRWTEAIPVVSKGGADRWAAKALTEAAQRTGLRHFAFKSDQEPSVLDLKNWVISELGDQYSTHKELRPVGEPQSIGPAEKAVDIVGGAIRTKNIAGERNYGIELVGTLP